jgi:hypothetical protein
MAVPGRNHAQLWGVACFVDGSATCGLLPLFLWSRASRLEYQESCVACAKSGALWNLRIVGGVVVLSGLVLLGRFGWLFAQVISQKEAESPFSPFAIIDRDHQHAAEWRDGRPGYYASQG